MHAAPRFGHTSDFSALFASTTATDEYVKGLICAASFILAILVVWCIALLAFKCLGKNRVGFLSGTPFTTPGRRPFYIRLVFVNATLLFILFTVLVVTQGITNLHDAVSTVGSSNSEVQSILSEANGIAISLESIGQSSLEVRDELTKNLGDFCPGEPNIQALTGVDFDALAQEAIVLLNELGNFIEKDINYLQTQIQDAQKTSNQLGSTVDYIEANDWQSLVVLIPYLTLATFMLIGVGLAWFDKTNPLYTCILSWGILPVLICATIAAFLLSAFVCLAAVGNAGMHLLACCGEHVLLSSISNVVSHYSFCRCMLRWSHRDAGSNYLCSLGRTKTQQNKSLLRCDTILH